MPPPRDIVGALRPGQSKGGRGQLGPKAVVDDLLARGFPADLIRQDIRARGFKRARIAQLLGSKDGDATSVKTSIARSSSMPNTLSECGSLAVGSTEPIDADKENRADDAEQACDNHIVLELGHIPVPADGLCLLHTAVAARDVQAWMGERDRNGWIRGPARERQDTAEAKALLAKIIKRTASKPAEDGKDNYHFIEAVRLQMAGSIGYPSMDQLADLADEFGGKIEMMDLDAQQSLTITYGSCGQVLYRVGHVQHRGEDGAMAEHWVLMKSYMDPAPLHSSQTQ